MELKQYKFKHTKNNRICIINTETTQGIIENIILNLGNIRNKISNRVDQLKKQMKILRFDNIQFTYEILQTNTQKYDQNVSNTLDNIRILVTNFAFDFKIKNQVSHMVLITNENNLGEKFDQTFDNCYYISSIVDFEEIMFGITIDILMFHYFLLNIHFDTVNKRRLFSLKKVAYINEKFHLKLTSNYEYFSKYSINSEGKFEVSDFINLWNDFIKSLVDNSLFANDEGIEKICQYLLTVYPSKGQISEKLIKNEIKSSDVNSFPLIIIRTEKKPLLIINRNELLKILNKSEWKNGKLKIVDFNKLRHFEPYDQFVSVYILHNFKDEENE